LGYGLPAQRFADLQRRKLDTLLEHLVLSAYGWSGSARSNDR
jgi:hypothetical protein